MTAASEAERRQLHDTFAALCRIPSPSGSERRCADAVSAELRGLGLTVAEDDAGAALGGDCGNLLARIPGSGERSLLFCAHLDTVPVAEPIEPVVRDGGWENAHEAILGADNKVAVATMLALARRLTAAPTAVGVELLFTVGEELALGRGQGVRGRHLAQPAGLHVRQRVAGRRRRRRLAHPLPDRRRAARGRRTRRCAA